MKAEGVTLPGTRDQNLARVIGVGEGALGGVGGSHAACQCWGKHTC